MLRHFGVSMKKNVKFKRCSKENLKSEKIERKKSTNTALISTRGREEKSESRVLHNWKLCDDHFLRYGEFDSRKKETGHNNDLSDDEIS